MGTQTYRSGAAVRLVPVRAEYRSIGFPMTSTAMCAQLEWLGPIVC